MDLIAFGRALKQYIANASCVDLKGLHWAYYQNGQDAMAKFIYEESRKKGCPWLAAWETPDDWNPPPDDGSQPNGPPHPIPPSPGPDPAFYRVEWIRDPIKKW